MSMFPFAGFRMFLDQQELGFWQKVWQINSENLDCQWVQSLSQYDQAPLPGTHREGHIMSVLGSCLEPQNWQTKIIASSACPKQDQST